MAAMGKNFQRPDAASVDDNALPLLGDGDPAQQPTTNAMDIDRKSSSSEQNKALDEARAYLRKLDEKFRKNAEDALAMAEAESEHSSNDTTNRSPSSGSGDLAVVITRPPKARETRTASDASSNTSNGGRDMSIKSLLNPPSQLKDVRP